MTQLRRNKKSACGCGDSYCPAHEGKACHGRALVRNTLYRIDTEDETGTQFCDPCFGDAHSSGLYSTDPPGTAGHELTRTKWNEARCESCVIMVINNVATHEEDCPSQRDAETFEEDYY